MPEQNRQITLILNVGEQTSLEPGSSIYVTQLTHPKLEGSLKLFHSQFVGRDEVLKSLDQNVVGEAMAVFNMIGEVYGGYKKATDPIRAPTIHTKK